AQAVQLAEERGIAIYARHSQPDVRGETIIRKNPSARPGVRAVASDASILAVHLSLRAETAAHVPELIREVAPLGLRFLRLDARGASGFLSQSQRTDAGEVLTRLGALARRLGRDLAELACVEGTALVSCIGSGLEDNPETVARACESLRAAAVSARELHTDAHTLAFVVPSHQRITAVRALHDVFLARRSQNA
ncbi:MAG TPA: hypothetical protein VIK91_25950, partial [Nannocystis sp.]